MKHKIVKNFSLLLFFCVHIQYALIIESDRLATVLDYIDPDTLVIFDIDNTLAHPTQELGSDQWFCYKVNEKMAEGFDYITSVHYVLPKTFYAQFNIPLELTEPYIPELIETLIEAYIPVMALSTRSLFIAERTLEQLENINIFFSMPHVNPDDLILPLPHPCFYKCGILFSGNNDKGEALICFFNIMNYYPKKVIFIDDKMKYLVSVEKALESVGIEFIGIRYSGCDERVNNFNAYHSELQWNALRKAKKHL
jgi:FMN phosphatase YigB (HAD superfamily)